MKFATSLLMVAATAGLAVLALTTRKESEVAEPVPIADQPGSPAERAPVPAEADAWFV